MLCFKTTLLTTDLNTSHPSHLYQTCHLLPTQHNRSLETTMGGGCGENSADEMMGYHCTTSENEVLVKKRVVVVIDQSRSRTRHVVMWALTHVVNKGDLLTLLHVVSHSGGSPQLAHSLGSLCKTCKPEVEVEALVIQGPKLATVLSQVKKLEASVLVLSQKEPSLFCCLFGNKEEEFVEECINRAECLSLAVRKQSGGLGGYLVSSRWQRNFWLLA